MLVLYWSLRYIRYLSETTQRLGGLFNNNQTGSKCGDLVRGGGGVDRNRGVRNTSRRSSGYTQVGVPSTERAAPSQQQQSSVTSVFGFWMLLQVLDKSRVVKVVARGTGRSVWLVQGSRGAPYLCLREYCSCR